MTNELEMRIAKLQQRSRGESGSCTPEEPDLEPAMSDLISGIRAMLSNDWADTKIVTQDSDPETLSTPPVPVLSGNAEPAPETVQLVEEPLVPLWRQRRWAWIIMGAACIIALIILLLAIWSAKRMVDQASSEVDLIRAANVAELREAREVGQLEVAKLHEELADQRSEVEQRILEAGGELAQLTVERDTLRAELEQFADLRRRVGIQLVDSRGSPVIIAPEGQLIRPWQAAGLHDLARYNGRMYRLISED